MDPVGSQTEFGAAEEHEVSGPDARLQDLLQRFGAFLHRTISRACPPELGLSCDDIEQEARIALWKALKSEREIAFPGSYIYRVAVSAALRAIRRARARREEPIEVDDGRSDAGSVPVPLQASASESPHVLAERQELKGQIELALAQLAENRRRAVRLHLQGLTTVQIGELVGWSEPKARNLVYRGLQDLRHALRAAGVVNKP